MKIGKFILAVSVFSVLAFIKQDPYRQVTNNSFKAGEHFDYKVKFSIFPVGEASVDVSPDFTMVNNRPCYQINVLGRTTGITDLFHIRNNYRSFVDTAAILPQKFYMNVKENNYTKQETILFDHYNNLAKSVEEGEKTTFKVPDNIQDVISSYYFLRTVDFSKMKVGDVFNTKMFFSDEIYPVSVKFNGREETKTKFGKIKILKLTPMLPQNKLFNGGEAIKIMVSDDKNRVPIKINVEFAVGSASMEIRSYRGIKNDFQWY